MSRHEIPARNPQHTVAVGWDNPLSTFFAQVSRPVDDEDEEDPIILWVGADRPREILTVEDLARCLAPFADLSPEMMERLRADRGAKLDQAPTQAQREAINFIRRSR
ncbi:hypothetical protein ACELLULO517_21860 [Acidisoma cellulosilytica]|uniref:Uncharacterized protein n=1 Tax=Acidisoma cellulosilyticum TaxID=2802395 RepID=A0A963Z6U9_9PROT|nr:hypothetical protein [Acidisoma cellulosilyticum]MCB8882908.1 hypothetical protein [Acidisoma cellulosilyticum]